jgi:hypothetical protein
VLVGEGTGGEGEALQYADPVPQYPHCEQQRSESLQNPLPLDPPPQFPVLVGEGMGGEGATPLLDIEISAQFQNCSFVNGVENQ